MKFIYISPFKSQNVTNFTFWKIILLEIHEVHLIQGKQFLNTTSETDTFSCSLKRRFYSNFPSNLDRDDLKWGRSECSLSKNYSEEAELNTWASQATAQEKRLLCPKGPCLCWLLGTQSSYWQVRSGPSQQGTDPKPCHLQPQSPTRRNFRIRLERCDMKTQTRSRCPLVDQRFCSHGFDCQHLALCLLIPWNMLNFKLLELLPKQVSRRQFPLTTAQRRCCAFKQCLVRRDGRLWYRISYHLPLIGKQCSV